MAAGESAAKQAAMSRARAEKLRARAEKAERQANWWELGEAGERRLADLVAPLTADGYFPLSDRCRPDSDGNLDCVLIGPPGVLLLDAKNWTGDLSVRGGVLRRGGYSQERQVESLRRARSAVSSLLEDVLTDRVVPVVPTICFVGDAQLGQQLEAGGVHLVDGSALVDFLRTLPTALTSREVDAVIARLVGTLPARSGSPMPAHVTEPAETVLFAQEWRKAGKARVYLKTTDGTQVGHLDLATAKVQCDDPEWMGSLTRLLPHFVDAAPEPEPEPGGLRKILGSLFGKPSQQEGDPVVVARLWQKHGVRRLYVDRIDESGTKKNLGWYDLDGHLAKPADASHAGVVNFCGSRYTTITAGAANSSEGWRP